MKRYKVKKHPQQRFHLQIEFPVPWTLFLGLYIITINAVSNLKYLNRD